MGKYNLKRSSVTIMIDNYLRIRDQNSEYNTFDTDIICNNTPIVCIKHNNPTKHKSIIGLDFHSIIYQILKEDFYKL
jgi:hypothetical protein